MQVLKTQPPVMPPGLVERRLLTDRLTAGAAGPVTLVCAGPGAGKTLTVASWTVSAATTGPVAWLSLDQTDNDLRTFWSDVIVAVLASGGVPEKGRLQIITPAAEFGAAEAREVGARLAEMPAPVVLVLDDFHEISSHEVLETFGWLVDHLPPALRLVVISRSDPDLRLHRFRLNGQLTEIRTNDLAFTEPEAVDLFQEAGITLAAEQIAALTERTEGWPAGLRLAALALDPADVAAGIERVTGGEGSIADYLVSEVTRRMSPQDRNFLLRTSVVERISGALANHLTDRSDGQLVLEGFVRANAFVVGLGGRGEWFSYHPLLRELMQHRLRLEQPDALSGLHQRVGQWMTDHGEPVAAVRHFILAGDDAMAGRLMLSLMPKLVTPEAAAVAAAVEPLAATAIGKPSLYALLASAACHYQRQQFLVMLQDTADARNYLDQADEDQRATVEVVLLLFEMVGARVRADTAATADFASRVIEIIEHTPRPRLPVGRAFWIIARINLGGAQLWNGHPKDTERLLGVAATEALDRGMLLSHLNATSHLALVDVMRGQFRAAGDRARQCLTVIDLRGWGSEPQALAVFLSLGLIELARQNPDAADAFVKRGLSGSGKETDRAIRLALAIAAVQVAVSRADAVAASSADVRMADGLARTPDASPLLVRWAAVAGAEALLVAGRPQDVFGRVGEPDAELGFVSCWERICLARARLMLGDVQPAEQLLAPLLRPGVPIRDAVVAANVLQAVIDSRRRRDLASLAALTAAIDLAQPEGIRRPFLLAGEALSEVLLRYRHLGGRHDAFAGEILQRLAPRPASAPTGPSLVDHLTDRELMVLKYLPTMLKAGEIADDLYVSVNTVKAHMRSVYRKLGVVNRRDAVETARATGLL